MHTQPKITKPMILNTPANYKTQAKDRNHNYEAESTMPLTSTGKGRLRPHVSFLRLQPVVLSLLMKNTPTA